MWQRLTVVFILLLSITGCTPTEEVEVEPLVESKRLQNESKVEEDEAEETTDKAEKKEQTKAKKEKDVPTEKVKANEGQEVVREQTDIKETKEKQTEQKQPEEPVTKKETKPAPKKTKQVVTEQTKKQPKESYTPNFSTTKKLLPKQNSAERTEKVTHAVIHFSSYAGVKPEDPYHVDDVYSTFEQYGVSAHYLIDRKGQIYELVPESRVAYHAGAGHLADYPHYEDKLNEYSIGIEVMAIGTEKEMLPMMSADTYGKIAREDIGYTDAQYTSIRVILDDLVARYPNLGKNRQQILGHDEYAKGRKTDPGELFDWSRLGF